LVITTHQLVAAIAATVAGFAVTLPQPFFPVGDEIQGIRAESSNSAQLSLAEHLTAREGEVLRLGYFCPTPRKGLIGNEVSELSRMTRSLMHLLETAQLLERKQVNLVSLRENIDTSTATGRCFLSMMGAIHQMERELRAERAAAGRASAKARGKTGGRPRTDVIKLRDAKVLYENSGKTGGRSLQGRWGRQAQLLCLSRWRTN
jgi:hypothetical protein